MNNTIRSNEKIVGIYKIKNELNGKFYIGQSINCNNRRRSHLGYLRNRKHQNEHLQNAWNKYGESNFSFKVIKLCNPDELDLLEIKYIDNYKSLDKTKGYNKAGGGKTNRYVSKESIHKMKRTKITRRVHAGEKNHNSVASNKDVESIIKDLLDGTTRKNVCDKYNVSIQTVNGIVQNRTYVYVATHLREKLKNMDAKLYESRINKAVELYEKGYSQNEIHKKINLTRRVISRELKARGIKTDRHVNQTSKQKLINQVTQ